MPGQVTRNFMRSASEGNRVKKGRLTGQARSTLTTRRGSTWGDAVESDTPSCATHNAARATMRATGDEGWASAPIVIGTAARAICGIHLVGL